MAHEENRKWNEAEIIYMKGKSYTVAGHRFVQNRPKVIHDRLLADHLENIDGFAVHHRWEDIPEEAPEPTAATKPKPAPKAKPKAKPKRKG